MCIYIYIYIERERDIAVPPSTTSARRADGYCRFP